MTADQYKHTWVLPADSRMLRMYGWMWKTEPEGTTFCKLFWGYVFAPINLLARLVWALLWPLRAVLRPVGRAMKESAAEAAARPEPPPKEPKEEIPGRIADFFAQPLTRRVCKIIGLCILVPLALVVLALVGWALVVFIPLIPVVLGDFVYWFAHTDAWVFVTTVVGVVVTGLVVIYVGDWLDKRYDLEARWERRKERRAAAGKLTFGQLLYHGAIAVKSNTCPRIEVKD